MGVTTSESRKNGAKHNIFYGYIKKHFFVAEDVDMEGYLLLIKNEMVI